MIEIVNSRKKTILSQRKNPFAPRQTTLSTDRTMKSVFYKFFFRSKLLVCTCNVHVNSIVKARQYSHRHRSDRVIVQSK